MPAVGLRKDRQCGCFSRGKCKSGRNVDNVPVTTVCLDWEMGSGIL